MRSGNSDRGDVTRLHNGPEASPNAPHAPRVERQHVAGAAVVLGSAPSKTATATPQMYQPAVQVCRSVTSRGNEDTVLHHH
ncbi:hypothetical protein EVAR_46347_1 [Eumeta japonica]|uniref:Uncharacterized protein n=1 Tax=Eumeta variegata TaxID=151549 RepID=A0A4C1WUQ4_EUMVA|nr:hypothetical protein EVAR_46347_1 [Eumeta japonica]